MPTTRQRHLITETEQVARALDDAAARWPEDRDRRAKLLLHLVEEGHRAVMEEQADRVAARRAAVARTSGTFTGVYDQNYLTRLHEDWPK